MRNGTEKTGRVNCYLAFRGCLNEKQEGMKSESWKILGKVIFVQLVQKNVITLQFCHYLRKWSILD